MNRFEAPFRISSGMQVLVDPYIASEKQSPAVYVLHDVLAESENKSYARRGGEIVQLWKCTRDDSAKHHNEKLPKEAFVVLYTEMAFCEPNPSNVPRGSNQSIARSERAGWASDYNLHSAHAVRFRDIPSILPIRGTVKMKHADLDQGQSLIHVDLYVMIEHADLDQGQSLIHGDLCVKGILTDRGSADLLELDKLDDVHYLAEINKGLEEALKPLVNIHCTPVNRHTNRVLRDPTTGKCFFWNLGEILEFVNKPILKTEVLLWGFVEDKRAWSVWALPYKTIRWHNAWNGPRYDYDEV